MKRIMITAAGGPAGFCLAKYLAGKAYLIGTDGVSDSPAQFFCDEMRQVPFAGEPGYEDEMLSAIRETRPDLIVPTFDEDLLFFDRVKDRVDCFVLLSPGKTLRVCDSKSRTASLFHDFSAETYTVEEARTGRPYPLFIRPETGRGSKVGFRIDDDADLEYALKKVGGPFIQKCLQGPEVTVDTFADLNGCLMGSAARVRVQTRGGISTKATFIRDDTIERCCREIHERLTIIGPANIQFMKDGDGKWKLIEINPRYAGGLGLSYQAGFDSITPLIDLGPGQKELRAQKMEPRYGVTVLRYWEERVVDV